MNTENIREVKFTDSRTIIANKAAIEQGVLAGISMYGNNEHIRSDNENDPPMISHVTHIIRLFVVIADPELKNHSYRVEIEFLDTKIGNKAKKAFDSIKSGDIDGDMHPILHSLGGTLTRMDMIYSTTPANPKAEKPGKFDMKGMIIRDFKNTTDDKEALKLCKKYNHMVEVILDSSESWVQWNNGTEEEDILYDFNEYFGKTDGVHNLFKSLNIISKPT